MGSEPTSSPVHMNISTVIIAVLLPVACIAVATALMRLFDVKEATVEQAQFEAEKLLAQVNRDVKMRNRVRAGVPINAAVADFHHFTALNTTRIRVPSA